MSDSDVAERLKAGLASVLDRHTEPSRIRIHRAISWLGRSRLEVEDPDAGFIFLWITFNAAYAREFGFEDSQREQLRAFITTLVSLDRDKRVHACLFNQFTGPVRTLIDNQFVFEPFWRAYREHDSSDRWNEQFVASKHRATKAVIAGDTETVLAVVFDRLYVLRNQLVHGGATWNSKVNRSQVCDGVKLLGTLVPIIVELMIGHPEADFGNIAYPVIMTRSA